jgi:hypothetical protein
MLGSDYRELIVPRLDNTAKRTAILVGGILVILLLIVLAFTVSTLFLLLTVAAGFGVWYFWTQERIEYEYVISGDQLDITKIIAQSKRKPMITVTFNTFQAFGSLRDAEPLSQSQTLVLACTAQDDSAFYADLDHSEFGQTRLIFTPNNDILLYLAKHLPRSLNFRWDAGPDNQN